MVRCPNCKAILRTWWNIHGAECEAQTAMTVNSVGGYLLHSSGLHTLVLIPLSLTSPTPSTLVLSGDVTTQTYMAEGAEEFSWVEA